MLNEKGFTLVELLISMVILVSIVAATLQFYENYSYEENQFGEYTTAKNLAVKSIEEQRDYFLHINDVKSGIIYEDVQRVNGIDFHVQVVKEDHTEDVAILTNEVKFIKLKSTVKWRSKKMEVETYVSEH